MTYDVHPDERGHNWGGSVDEHKSFAMLPYHVYRSVRAGLDESPVHLELAEEGKTALTEQGRASIVGVQGQLWAETIRGPQWVEYYMFPKMFGLIERGWNAHPDFEELRGEEEELVFHKELAHYYRKLGEKEFPYLAQSDVNFRLPYPGLCLRDGMLYANTPIYGAEIRYTTDGTVPTEDSALWTEPVSCVSSCIQAKLFYLGKQSVTAVMQ